jgi:predicted NUDIX family NTP pyrophosphohydrolase
MEWPPYSRKRATFPELDRVAYFVGEDALVRILASQTPLIHMILLMLAGAATR